MKKSATTLVGAAVLGLILSGAAWDSKAQGVKTGKAEVRSAGEGARYSTTANVWVPVKKGDKLPEGATIASSSTPVDLSLNDSIVRVQPNTTIRLDKLSGGTASGVKIVDTQLNLVDGRVTANIRKLAAGARYEVKIDFSPEESNENPKRYEVLYRGLGFTPLAHARLRLG